MFDHAKLCNLSAVCTLCIAIANERELRWRKQRLRNCFSFGWNSRLLLFVVPRGRQWSYCFRAYGRKLYLHGYRCQRMYNCKQLFDFGAIRTVHIHVIY